MSVARPLNVAVIFNAVSAGLVDFVVASATAGHLTPETASVTDGKVYEYYAITNDGLVWESGKGPYTIATHTIARTTISSTSNDDDVKVNFPTAPIVCVLPSPSTTLEQGSIPSGTVMLFWQAAAPVGWTLLVTQNDKALRVVSSGGGASGGTNSFSSVMAQTVVGNTTPTIGTTAPHTHTSGLNPAGGSQGVFPSCGTYQIPFATGSTGGGTAHNHTILMAIQYIDLILCSKN